MFSISPGIAKLQSKVKSVTPGYSDDGEFPIRNIDDYSIEEIRAIILERSLLLKHCPAYMDISIFQQRIEQRRTVLDSQTPEHSRKRVVLPERDHEDREEHGSDEDHDDQEHGSDEEHEESKDNLSDLPPPPHRDLGTLPPVRSRRASTMSLSTVFTCATEEESLDPQLEAVFEHMARVQYDLDNLEGDSEYYEGKLKKLRAAMVGVSSSRRNKVMKKMRSVTEKLADAESEIDRLNQVMKGLDKDSRKQVKKK